VITLQLPPAGITVKSQLWNFSLLNASGNDMDVQVEVTLTDLSTNQRVLTGSSRLFRLPKGIKQVQAADVTPVTYNVNNPSYGVDASPVGFLPIGSFAVCFSVLKINNDATERLGEECETVEIEPINPPMLVLPEDSGHIEQTRPLFTWLPPSPFNLFNNIRYDWVLVAIMPTQTAAAAVQDNVPVLSQSNTGSNTFQYPLSLPELDSSKLYAWQVTAKNNNSPIAKSEIWTFRIVKENSVTIIKTVNKVYAKLRRYNDASFVQSGNTLYYEYLNEINDPSAAVKVWDISSNTRKELLLDNARPVLQFGQNFMSLDLSNQQLVNKHVYLFELTNSKNEQWYLKFEYHGN
jgi:hypothetical protein